MEPKSLFPSSPDYHVRQSRKPMIRSPSPEPVKNKARTPAKSKTPAKSVTTTPRVTRSARKVKATPSEPMTDVLPPAIELAEATVEVTEPVVKSAAPEVVPSPSRATLATPIPPFNTKSAFTLMGVAAVGIVAAFFSSGTSAPATPVWSDSISLKGSNTIYLTQGDVYKEQGVTFTSDFQKAIMEGNPSPSISYEYSQPSVAFSDFVSDIGSFNVEYQVNAPWFGDVKLTRHVIVSDVNECTYSGSNDMFKNNCSPSETCTNTVGSFSCN